MNTLEPIERYRRGELNCAQATVASILGKYSDIDSDTITHTFTLLGNGVTKTGTCGILLGSLAALGKILTDQGLEEEELKQVYSEVTEEFLKKFNAHECNKILRVHEDETIDFRSEEIIQQCSPRMEEIIEEVAKIIDFKTNPAIPIMRRFSLH